MRTSRMRLIVQWIPALVGIGVIVVESTAMMSANNTSRWLLPLWKALFGPITAAHWAVVHFYIRKTGHVVGYGTVSLTFFNAWRVTLEQRWPLWPPASWTRFRNAAGLALLSTVMLASWDEWHQSFLAGRTSSVRDVVLDFCGACCAHLILMGIVWFRGRPRGAVEMQAA
jgi:VanZ family protein